MHQMFGRLIERLCIQTLAPEGRTAVSRFKDIVIQSGSSFALKKKLRDGFPARLKAIEPAAVEIQATYRGFSNEVRCVEIAPDKEAERQFLPTASTLKDRLPLADRGYPAVDYFEAVDDEGGSFIVRPSRSNDPWVSTNGSRTRTSTSSTPPTSTLLPGSSGRASARQFSTAFPGPRRSACRWQADVPPSRGHVLEPHHRREHGGPERLRQHRRRISRRHCAPACERPPCQPEARP